VLADVVDLHHVGVRELAERARLAEEQLAGGVRAAADVEELERDAAIELGVIGRVHGAHAATAQEREDEVAADACAAIELVTAGLGQDARVVGGQRRAKGRRQARARVHRRIAVAAAHHGADDTSGGRCLERIDGRIELGGYGLRFTHSYPPGPAARFPGSFTILIARAGEQK
jgi:hypothetical protein